MSSLVHLSKPENRVARLPILLYLDVFPKFGKLNLLLQNSLECINLFLLAAFLVVLLFSVNFAINTSLVVMIKVLLALCKQ